jgi:hypothetical protein
MKVTVSIDVPSLDGGIKFFGDAFGFSESSRPHPGYVIMTAGEARRSVFLPSPQDHRPRRAAVTFADISVIGRPFIRTFASTLSKRH